MDQVAKILPTGAASGSNQRASQFVHQQLGIAVHVWLLPLKPDQACRPFAARPPRITSAPDPLSTHFACPPALQ